jgi:hypothetical protein
MGWHRQTKSTTQAAKIDLAQGFRALFDVTDSEEKQAAMSRPDCRVECSTEIVWP